jgi:hypothetical protein
MSDKLTSLGRTQLVVDCENFVRRLFSSRRRAALARARKKETLARFEAALETRLDDVSSIMGLPPEDPVVIAAVLHSMKLARLRREVQEEEAEMEEEGFHLSEW